MQRTLWFIGSSGLDITYDPARIPYDKDKGVLPAAIALNVDISKTMRLSRRKGWQYTEITGSCHSLFCDGGPAFYIYGDALKLFTPGAGSVSLRNVTVDAPMCYVQVGSRTFYTNGRETGFILNGKSYGWNTATPNQKDSTIVYSPPPVGSLIGYYKGRLYVIQQHVVWYSEPNNLNTFNLKKYLPFSSAVKMFKGVSKGIWVGTENQVFYLKGNSPEEIIQERKAFARVVPGSATYIDCTSIPGLVDEYGYQIEGVGIIFIADKGIYLGTEDGKLIQFSRGKLEVPNALMGAGVCIKDRYITSVGDNLYNNRLTVCEELVISAISQYTNYNFNSFAEIEGNFYGANSDGIFKLDVADNDVSSSTTATAIDAYYKSVLTDFGILAEKRLRKCNGALEANGEVKFTFSSNEKQEVVQHTVPAFSDNKQHSIEVPCGRSLKGRYYDFIVENINGADFSIDNLEAFIEVLSRKPEKRGSN